MTSTETARTPRGRSPSYPGISLPAAVERARVIYDRYKQFKQPVKVVTDAWGYKAPTTGPATVTFAALKKYGLLEDAGSGPDRTATLTRLAVDILMKPDPTEEIRKAALSPPIHKEMWDKFGAAIPTDDELRYEYTVNRGFTEAGLRDFLHEYRETIAFAMTGSSGTLDGEDPLGEPEGLDDDQDTDLGRNDRRRKKLQKRPEGGGDVLTYPLAIAPGIEVTIEGRFPLTEAQWTQMLRVLDVMKPGLVADETPETRQTVDEDE